MIRINDYFDAGSIRVVDAEHLDDIELKLKVDSHHDDIRQWFYFRVSGGEGQALHMCISNAHDAAFNDWDGYQVMASYDQQDWFRIPTRYEGGELLFEHTPQFNSVYYAYFEPYSQERHQQLIAASQRSPHCRAEVLGESVDGRDMDLLVIGKPEAARKIWIIARQHPGETMSEWFVEGLLQRLLDENDGVATALRSQAVFYIVPNMNPDGAVRGNQRTNASGANLNREWDKPSRKFSPEVLVVKDRVEKTGADMFFDIHGEECIPYVFLAGSEGNSSFTERQAQLEAGFSAALKAVNADFQTEEGYGKDEKGEANMSLASNYAADRFDCLALTLEMPFKDALNNPNLETGWTSARSKRLGHDFLVAILAVLPKVRGDELLGQAGEAL